MKTDHEWIAEYGKDDDWTWVNKIQLDAMKEGARRAAIEVKKDHGKCHCMECGEEKIDKAQAILATAEQWTEKNL